jgi:hypothetical protein
MAVLCVVPPRKLVEVYRRFSGAYCLQHQDDGGSKRLLNVGTFYQTVRHNNTQDSHLHIRRRENLKSHKKEDVKWI